ncbi:MAG: hypothetical protein UIC65_01885 [Alphaproteobacteria bacterium]|nr:hypothetical protein [Alphaproteobacteria bacterium]
MKKMFACVLALCPMIASADYLDDKIASLTKEKLDKIAKLEECQKSTKGLKIAGITTLGVSAIGIGANIGEAVKLNKLEAQIGAAETNKSDLDKQISAAKEEKAKKEKAAEEEQERQAANNTCGNTVCTGVLAKPDELNAKGVTCVNNEWKAAECKENFAGTQKSCKSNGITVTYYENCSANASTDETCQEITQEWLTQNHVKSVECDKTTRENYITECADSYKPETGENNRITKCVPNEQAQPVVQDRAHHSACTDAEKADLQSKGANEVWVYNNKCVPKSCKTDWYLVVKGNSSQGYCVNTCPDYQKVEKWTNGGQACDKLESATAEVVKECTDNKETFKSTYYAKEVACDTSLGKWYVVECKDGYDTEDLPGNSLRKKCTERNNCPAGFVDLKKQTAYYGYKYSPSMSNMEAWFKIDSTYYKSGIVTYQDADAQTMNNASWRQNKAKELAEKKLTEKKWCNYQLEYSANLF